MAEFQTNSTRVPLTDAEIRAANVGEAPRLDGPIELVDYDPDWPRLFQREAHRIQSVLGKQALRIEHVGSTSVPGLCAKPRIDIVLVVPDSSDEPAYVPAMEQAGYPLRIREPDWFQHRVFKGPDTDTNIHVFSEGCSEIDRMTRFRDWLRAHPEDRDLYAAEKRVLAKREWKYVQNYADAKTAVIDQIIARAAPCPARLPPDGPLEVTTVEAKPQRQHVEDEQCRQTDQKPSDVVHTHSLEKLRGVLPC